MFHCSFFKKFSPNHFLAKEGGEVSMDSIMEKEILAIEATVNQCSNL
jgi:hypothetical protein